MNQEETNTYSTSLPLHMWRNKITWRTTNTGMNPNVISTCDPHYDKREIIKYIRSTAIPYKTTDNLFKGKEEYNYFTTIIGDCLHEIYSGRKGYVFSDVQLRKVMKILPSVKVKWDKDYECYCCWM